MCDENVSPELMVLRDKIAALKRQNDALQAEVVRAKLTPQSQGTDALRRQAAQFQLLNDQLNAELQMALQRAAAETQNCTNLHATIFSMEREIDELKQEVAMASLPSASPYQPATSPAAERRSRRVNLAVLKASRNFQVGADWLLSGEYTHEMFEELARRLNETGAMEYATAVSENLAQLAPGNFRTLAVSLWQAAECLAFDAGNAAAVRLLALLVKAKVPQDTETLWSLLQKVGGGVKKFPGLAKSLFDLATLILLNSTFSSTPGIHKRVQSDMVDLILIAGHSLDYHPMQAMRFLYVLGYKVPEVLAFASLRCGSQCINIAQRITICLANCVFGQKPPAESFVSDSIKLLSRIACVKADKDRARELVSAHSTTSSTGEVPFKPPAIFGHYAVLLEPIVSELSKSEGSGRCRRLELNIIATFHKEITRT